MSTTVRRVMGLAALFSASMLILMSGAPTASAGDIGTGSTAGTQTSGGNVSVSLSGTGYVPGSSGSGGTVGPSVVSPCWMTKDMSGKEYFDYVKSGKPAWEMEVQGLVFVPLEGWEAHSTDTTGYWFFPECISTYTGTFVYDHRVHAFYAANEPTPTAPIEPQQLFDVAFANLTLPSPQVDWNPKRAFNQGTLVNLPTWFWLTADRDPTLQVTAAAQGHEATVTVTSQGMDIIAEGEDPKRCDGFGTPYSAGADATCWLAFSRASSALGTQATPVTSTPVTVAPVWSAAWEYDRDPQAPITAPTAKAAALRIQVDEVQTLVTSTP